MFVTYDGRPDPTYSGEVMELDLSTVQGSLSGPKRPHDRVDFSNMKNDFNKCLTNKVGFKGFGLSDAEIKKSAKSSQQPTTDVKQRSSYLHRLLSISLFIILYCPNGERMGRNRCRKRMIMMMLHVFPFISHCTYWTGH